MGRKENHGAAISQDLLELGGAVVKMKGPGVRKHPGVTERTCSGMVQPVASSARRLAGDCSQLVVPWGNPWGHCHSASQMALAMREGRLVAGTVECHQMPLCCKLTLCCFVHQSMAHPAWETGSIPGCSACLRLLLTPLASSVLSRRWMEVRGEVGAQLHRGQVPPSPCFTLTRTAGRGHQPCRR